MIENLHRTLNKIVEEREARINHLKAVFQHVEDRSGQPFEEKDKARNLEIFKDTLILDIPTESSLHSIKTFRDALEHWVKNSNSEKKKRDKRSFLELLKTNRIFDEKHLNQPLETVILDNEGNVPEATNILYIFTLRAHREISSLKIPESSKNTYLGYISKIEEMMTNYLAGVEKLLWVPYLENTACAKTPKNRFNLKHREIAKFLEFVEQKALNSTSIRPYKALLLCRSLICAPLPAKKLFSLAAPNEQNSSLECEGQEFPVTATFIKLWKCFDEKYLFPNSLRTYRNPEQYLNLTIKRLSKRAKLPICLTPTMLRLVREAYSPKIL